MVLPKVTGGNPSPWQLWGACCGIGARRDRLGLHKEVPYPKQWDWQQLKTAKITCQPAPEAPSPILIKLTAYPARTDPWTLLTPWRAVGSFAHPSILVRRTSCRAAATAAFSHPFLFPTWCYGTLSALRRCRSPPGYPRLMTVLFTPLGKSVIFPSRWVLVPSDQLINYVLVWLCSAFSDAKLPPSLRAPCNSQSGTGIAHQI